MIATTPSPSASAKAGSSTPAAQPTDPKQRVATADTPNSELGERGIEETEKIEQREALDPVMVERIDRASRRIAPAWPLDRMIAVNPYWGFRDRPIESASAQLEGVAGSRLVMPHHYYLQLFQKGAFKLEHIAAALNERDIALEPETVVDRLKRPEPAPKQRETVADLLHPERALTRGMSTREYIVDSISRFCAGYFTRKNPDEDLYAAWKQEIRNDLRPRWAGLPDMRRAPLAPTAEEMIALTLRELDVADAEQEDYLTTLLFDVVGWASHCAYVRWNAELEGGEDHRLVELLAIRAAWEYAMYRDASHGFLARFQQSMSQWPQAKRNAETDQMTAWIAGRALEQAFQQQIAEQFARPLAVESAPDVQAAFCIDVRSEIFRRALEAQSNSIQTLGFAGFFGLPAEYRAIAAEQGRPQLPGLLAPKYRITDTEVDAAIAHRRSKKLAFKDAWKAFKDGAISGFSLVESTGFFAAAELLRGTLGLRTRVSPERAGLTSKEHHTRRPRLTEHVDGSPVDLAERCDLAEAILTSMSLTRGFARVIVLFGHSSKTANNPQSAGLDCGACCGQSGEVNARAVAALLNESEVRQGLAVRGITIPETTIFLAGLHNTTTDEAHLYELDRLPEDRLVELERFQKQLNEASEKARRERAPSLGLGELAELSSAKKANGKCSGHPELEVSGRCGNLPQKSSLAHKIRQRADSWSEVRPEWGLTGNAAFVVARRSHTKHLNLEGRSFLHDYRYEEDQGFKVLEQIMTAPMIVTHWINAQYLASTVDNRRFGSGNKVLHDVVGDHLGVFEGNGGDLRIGLAMQSIHDGVSFRHQPLRLSVYVEAPQDAIDSVIDQHEVVRQLVEHGWIHLFQVDRYRAVHKRDRNGWS